VEGPARDLLEDVILRAIYAEPAVRHVLFVGVAAYTAWYPRAFATRPRLTFVTVDPTPAERRHGSRKHHVVGRVEELADEPVYRDAFDVIVLNGLFGYGTDSRNQDRAVLDAAHALLAPSGRAVLGYGNEGSFTPDLVDPVRFEPYPVPGLGRPQHPAGSDNHHVFACFAKVTARQLAGRFAREAPAVPPR
jgi:hypothetical protein